MVPPNTDLEFSSDSDPGFSRRRFGKGFAYYDPAGEKVTSPEQKERFDALAIPPAYVNVWICAKENGHLQATGIDTRERKQYRYHPDWREFRNRLKFQHLVEFGEALSRIRARVLRDLESDEISKDFLVAAAIRLLDHTGARIGNEHYLEENQTHGITTLTKEHVEDLEEDGQFTLHYRAKGGKEVEFDLSSETLAKAIHRCTDLPGERLFQYKGRDGEFHSIHSNDVNDYLDEFGEHISAKAFRTWKATLTCFAQLSNVAPPEKESQRTKRLNEAIRETAGRLYHRPATCRKFYIHPKVIDTFLQGEEIQGAKYDTTQRAPRSGRSAMEQSLIEFLVA